MEQRGVEEQAGAQRNRSRESGAGPLSIAIASTFTIEPLRRPLTFWLERLQIPAEVDFAPYAQVLQALLDERSLLSRNAGGINVLAIRIEDWIRDRSATETVARNIEHLNRTISEFSEALLQSVAKTKCTTLVFLAPSSSSIDASYRRICEDAHCQLLERFRLLERVHCWTHEDLMALYAVADYEDFRADRIGHIPYTSNYFAALSTLLVRRIAVLIKPPCKVIAVDCDNTLWRGIVGEDGVTGIEIAGGHLALQRLLVRQHDQGVLICLCSKNNWADVEAVFNSRPDMILTLDHLVSWRVNWLSKSENLQALAHELQLGLDSFVFIDDSEIECAEVRAGCPAVMAFKFPSSEPEVGHFLSHVWPFDHLVVTADAKRRTQQYRQNRERHEAMRSAGRLGNFLDSLELTVNVTAMVNSQLARVAELVQRTNQFNLTGIRRNAGELEALWKSRDVDVRVVDVRDRFGDYGLVGVLILRWAESCLHVDTFVLSCRVLGRGVEHRILRELAGPAEHRGAQSLILRLRPTARNQPAADFLTSCFGQFRDSPGTDASLAAEYLFRVPLGYLRDLRLTPGGETLGDAGEPAVSKEVAVPEAAPISMWVETAFRLSRMPDLYEALSKTESKGALPLSMRDGSATTIEAEIASIWADLLGRKEIGVLEDFFDLGGDSVLAVQAISRMASALGMELSLHEFFEGPSAREVARRLSRAANAELPIARVSWTEPLPLSSAQQRLWFIDRLEGNSVAYHVPVAIRLNGRLDANALRASLGELFRRHDSLRTVFVEIDGKPAQTLVPHMPFELQMGDLSSAAQGEREAAIESRLRKEIAEPFNLLTGPLLRALLIRLSADEHVLAITMHHIVSDGWSLGVLVRELSELYTSFADGASSTLPPLPVQYIDYAQWQLSWPAPDEANRQLQYWRDHLADCPEQVALPSDRPRPAALTYRGSSVPIHVDRVLTTALKAFGRRVDLTMAMTMFAAWALVLSRLSNQEDMVIGMPVANRRRGELEGLIGFLANTVCVRVRLDGGPSIEELLTRVKASMLGAYANQDIPFERVVEALRPARSLNRTPLFQVMFVLENAPQSELHFPGIHWTEQSVPVETAQFDLLLSIQERQGEIVGSLSYSSDLFNEATIQRWAGYFETSLRGIVEEDGRLPVSQLQILGDDERRHLLKTLAGTGAEASCDKTLHDLFEAQTQRAPEAIAVVDGASSITYGELHRRADRLARCLRARQVRRGDIVALCVERGLSMAVGLIGILKAGAAYLPLDQNYPRERLRYMLADANPRIVVAQNDIRSKLPEHSAEELSIDSVLEPSADDSELAPLSDSSGSPMDLAYVIYTSGSTGNPKGVAIEHRNVTRLFLATHQWFEFDRPDVWVMLHSFAFDFSVWEMWGALLHGGRLVMVPHATARSPDDLYDLIRQQRVTVLNQTPSAFTQLIESSGRSREVADALRLVIFGGEALDLRSLVPWVECYGVRAPQLVNMYGITETTVHVTYRPLTEEEIYAAHGSPIGVGIPDLRVYLLDRQRQPVPIGAVGEIFVGGAGVARGYLNRPDLTAERFVADPFGGAPGARLYKAGDLGRWRSDEGDLEYLGRNDNQVKVRGFRIEPEEIAAQLVRYPGVKDAVIIPRGDDSGERRLVAYFIPVTDTGVGAGVTAESLRSYLKDRLPDYMVPAAFVSVLAFPLTTNGKLDRDALPGPDAEAYAREAYESPRGEIEIRLADIWQTLLSVEHIGRRDNFFELGGHSLMIVRMMEHLRGAGLTADIRRIYETPTLAEMARTLDEDRNSGDVVPPNLIPSESEAITPDMLTLIDLDTGEVERIIRSIPGGASNVQDIYPLAPLQEGMVFHYLMKGHVGDAYVSPTLLRLSSREKLHELTAALQRVIERHDSLRTAILWEDLPTPVQVVCRRAQLPVIEVNLDSTSDIPGQLAQWLKPEKQIVDIRRAPLLRLQIAADPHSLDWYALFQIHHIVSDNTSQDLILEEVVAYLEGRGDQLPMSIPYRAHVAHALRTENKASDASFFRTKMADLDGPTAPFGLLDVYEGGADLAEASQMLAHAISDRVRAQMKVCGVSPAVFFHAVWALVVAHTSARDDVTFGSVLLGRLHGRAGAQHTVGTFINTLPLRLPLSGVSARGLIASTHRELAALLDHEQASLAEAQKASGIGGTVPLFSALMNYRHSARSPEGHWASVPGVRVLAHRAITNYPITLSVDDLGQGFRFTLQVDRSVSPDSVLRYVNTVSESFVEALERAPDTPALMLRMLPDEELHHIVRELNSTRPAQASRKLVHHLFEDEALRSRTTVAIEHGESTITYSQLDDLADRVAERLLALGVGIDEVVGVCTGRSPEMVVALLAIFKAGAVYMPLDPDHPPDRLREMIADAKPRVVLIRSGQEPPVPASSIEWIELDTGAVAPSNDGIQRGRLTGSRLLEGSQTGSSLLYVIYTSGSTGRPKGTGITHQAIVNLIEWQRSALPDTRGCRVLQLAALSFDVSIQEVLTTLCGGGTLILLDEWIRRDAAALTRFIAENAIQRLFVPPLLLQSVAEHVASTGVAPESLEDVVAAGEQLRITPDIRQLFCLLSRCRLHNHYGPTETHAASALTLPEDRTEWPDFPRIGRGVDHARLYVLDTVGGVAPLGVPGELFIGGGAVARGYLNKSDVTAERFIADRYSRELGGRLYRTGDVVRWSKDGILEYLGRRDNQVKIRGYRVEPGEIEAQLVTHCAVKEAAVLAREDVPGNKRLVAYILSTDAGAPTPVVLREYLEGKLPEYMLPSAFVVMQKFPLTSNGKLDRRSLPPPGPEAFIEREYKAPQGSVEVMLAEIWADLLGVQRVGREDSFFDLGGHSLLATRLTSRIRRLLDLELAVKSVFDAPTVRALAALIEVRMSVRLTEDEESLNAAVGEIRADISEMSEEEIQRRIAELEREAGGRVMMR